MERPENDLVGINDDNYWPHWPFLPIKRKGKNNNFGYEFALLHTSNKSKAIFGNIFRLPKTTEEFEKLPSIIYDSVEEMLADGWIVD